jgi:Double zinc ribbon
MCPSCGFANPEGFTFCGKCGARVAEAPAPGLQGSPVSARSYTPKHLAEKILNSKSALERERKQVTVRRPQGLDGATGRPRSRGSVVQHSGELVPSKPHQLQ